MSKCFSTWQLLFSLLLFTILFSNCKKINEDIGNNLVPPSDLLSVKFDSTVLITAKSVESKVSSKNVISSICLGVHTDPLYGDIKASVLASYVPEYYFAEDTDFVNFVGENYIIDSVILHLTINDLGVSSVEDNFDMINIYEMIKPMNIDDDLYSNMSIDLLQDYYSLIKINNYIKINYDEESTVYNIKYSINKEIGESLLNPLDSEFSEFPYKDANSFIDAYKGFYFKIDDSGLLPNDNDFYMNLNLFNDSTSLTVYFSYDDTTKKELKYSFKSLVDNDPNDDFEYLYATSYNHVYYDSIGEDSKLNNQLLVYQFGVYELELDFPDFTEWIDSVPIAINKAELIIPVDMDISTVKDSFLTQQMIIRYKTSNGDLGFLADEQLYAYIDENEINGWLDYNLDAYVFSIRNHLQFILDVNNGVASQENATLVIKPNFYNYNNGVVLTNESINKIQLNIWYTDLKDK